MRNIAAAALALAFALVPVPQAGASEEGPRAEVNLLFYAGVRSLDAEFWSPLEIQGTFGVEIDFTPSQWPVGLMASGMIAGDNRGAVVIADGIPVSADFEVTTAELDLGPRRYFHLTSWLDLYLNAGISLSFTTIKASSQWTQTQSSTFSSVGGFYGGGAAVRLGLITAGMEVRVMSAPEITVFGEKGKADYTQVSFTFGWRF